MTNTCGACIAALPYAQWCNACHRMYDKKQEVFVRYALSIEGVWIPTLPDGTSWELWLSGTHVADIWKINERTLKSTDQPWRAALDHILKPHTTWKTASDAAGFVELIVAAPAMKRMLRLSLAARAADCCNVNVNPHIDDTKQPCWCVDCSRKRKFAGVYG